MTTPIISKIRNHFESTRWYEKLIYLLTQNEIYYRFVYHKFKQRLKDIEDNKSYGFAIEVSSFCNAKCFFCPNVKMQRTKNSMNMDIFMTLIKRIKEEKINPRYFNMTGTGEPLLDKTIFEKIKIIKNEFPKTYIFMPTNFALANKEIIKNLLESGLDKITISLNADNEKDYKEIMKIDYKKTLSNIDLLLEMKSKAKSKLHVMVTVAANPINKKSINSFNKKWEAKVDEVAINWIHDWAGAVDTKDGKSTWKKRYPCRTLFEQIVVHSNGNIPLCCIDYEGIVIGGNVKDKAILESFNGDKIKKIKDMHRNGQIDKFKMCANCRFSERGLDWLV